MSQRINVSSGVIWEDIVGYSRAVKIGNIIEISGTTSVAPNGEILGKNDVYEQTVFILKKIEGVLKDYNASLRNVVRTRMYIKDIERWEQAGRAHGEFFRDIKPATTMIEISKLIHPDLLIEIEASAVL
ncbi:MAG: RidA family protein [Bacteroidetes bacterium]|jgi:enamine deaminase RidA (YjgF/YER057c/UK114 family)|nr:RidA family protein [Bacteroidota bacterium]